MVPDYQEVESSVFCSEVGEEGLGLPQGDSWVFTELPYRNAVDSHWDRKQIFLFHICQHNMKITLFLKSRITVAIIIQRIFLLCIIFKKIGDRDCCLSIWRQGAQVHCLGTMLLALKEGWQACAAGRHTPWALLLSIFPREGKSILACLWEKPALYNMGGKSINVGEELRRGSCKSRVAHLN